MTEVSTPARLWKRPENFATPTKIPSPWSKPGPDTPKRPALPATAPSSNLPQAIAKKPSISGQVGFRISSRNVAQSKLLWQLGLGLEDVRVVGKGVVISTPGGISVKIVPASTIAHKNTFVFHSIHQEALCGQMLVHGWKMVGIPNSESEYNGVARAFYSESDGSTVIISKK